MTERKKRYLFFVAGFIACCFSFTFCPAQNPMVKTSIDKNEILIGEQIKLKVEAAFSPDEYKMKPIDIPDSLGHFEVVSRSAPDSMFTNEGFSGMSQTCTITSFDSGQWTIPSFAVRFDPVNNDSVFNAATDSFLVTISYAVDSTHQLNDIKPIREVTVPDDTWYWVGGGVFALLLIVLLYYYFKKRKNSILPISSAKAYEEAMDALEKLKRSDLNNPEQIKIYYSKLATIFREYLTQSQQNNYLSKTTGEVLLLLRENKLDAATISKAAAALRCSDAVKFAKYLPTANESSNYLMLIKETIGSINHYQPV